MSYANPWRGDQGKWRPQRAPFLSWYAQYLHKNIETPTMAEEDECLACNATSERISTVHCIRVDRCAIRYTSIFRKIRKVAAHSSEALAQTALP